ncbi:hypothetical protein [Modestobacter sp. NPDC049651]|uniref:hypothetical protein n=1 Tax=unclassified Modestobacter TaxID=2643866 RepID=UPI0033F79BF9
MHAPAPAPSAPTPGGTSAGEGSGTAAGHAGGTPLLLATLSRSAAGQAVVTGSRQPVDAGGRVAGSPADPASTPD